MQVPLNACCVGDPFVTQLPLSTGAALVLAAMSIFGALIVLAAAVNAGM